MGMFDEKRYLTGPNGIVKVGDEFHLHGAQVSGQVRKPDGNGMVDEVALLVSRTGAEDPITVFTTGTAIVGQVKRQDDGDRRAFAAPGGVHVRLTERETGAGRNPMHLLEPVGVAEDQTPPPVS